MSKDLQKKQLRSLLEKKAQGGFKSLAEIRKLDEKIQKVKSELNKETDGEKSI